MDRSIRSSGLRRLLLALGFGVGAMGMAPVQAQPEPCGGVDYPFPYTDVASVGAAFCPGIMEAYVTGVSKGTTSNTFSPNETVTRVQMTTFLQRSLDQGVTRASRRTVLKQPWQVSRSSRGFGLSSLPVFCAADGENIWVAAHGEVYQVQGSTGKVLGTWTGFTKSWPIAAIPSEIITADNSTPGNLYIIDTSQPPGVISSSIPLLADGASSIAFDGANTFIANFSGSVSVYSNLGGTLKNYGGFSHPVGLVYDGAQMWVTDYGLGALFPVASNGTIGTGVPVGAGPQQPAFDGENIWVPNSLDSSITVIQASSGKLVATIVSDGINMLSVPEQASFDGERILVTNVGNDSVTLFKAADLSVIVNVPFTDTPYGVCSDGSHFWVTLKTKDFLVQL
jgi:YVTN family beta-propeller protein